MIKGSDDTLDVDVPATIMCVGGEGMVSILKQLNKPSSWNPLKLSRHFVND